MKNEDLETNDVDALLDDFRAVIIGTMVSTSER